MRFLKPIFGLSFLFLIAACNHPIVVNGEGDVTSASGSRNCYLEDYRAGSENCKKNTVVNAYQETYYATARSGWEFNFWEGCQVPAGSSCSFDIPQSAVFQAWGQTAPPLVANFRRASISEANSLYYTAGNYGFIGLLDPSNGQTIASYNQRILGGLADIQLVNGELYAIKGLGSELYKLNNHRLKPVGLNNGLKVRIRVD